MEEWGLVLATRTGCVGLLDKHILCRLAKFMVVLSISRVDRDWETRLGLDVGTIEMIARTATHKRGFV